MPYYHKNLLVLSITIFTAAVCWNQIMPFLPLVLQDMGVGKSSLLWWSGALYTAGCATSIVAQPFWGWMGDRYGRKPMTIRAGLCLAGIYFAMSLCHNPWQLAAVRLLNGALTGFIPGSVALISTNTPPRLAGQSVATAQTSSAAGQIAGPAIGGLMAAFVGYRGTMIASGIAAIVATILVWLLVQEPHKPDAAQRPSLMSDIRSSFSIPRLPPLMLATMFQGFFVGAAYPFIVLHLRNISPGITDWKSGTIYAFPALGLMLTAHLWARAGGAFGYRRMIVTGLVGTAAGAAGMAALHLLTPFSLAFLLTGCFSAAVTACAAAATCHEIGESVRGRAFGMQNSASLFGAALGPMMSGWVGTAYGIPAAFGVTGGVILLGAVAFLVLARRSSAAAEPR